MEKLPNLVFGSPAEQEARATNRKYKRQLPQNHRERQEQAKASILARHLTRRQVILGSLVAVPAIAAGGIALYEHLQPDVYHGPLEDLEGLPLVDNEHMQRIVESLNRTQNPFLMKIGNDMHRMYLSQENSPELRRFDWLVSEEATPLPVVTNRNSAISQALLQAPYDKNVEKFVYASDDVLNGAIELNVHKPFMVGIDIATQNNPPGDRLREGLAAVKEFSSLTTIFLYCKEGYDWISLNKGEIRDLQGNQFTDRLDQLRAGMAVEMLYIRQDTGRIGRVADGLPIFMVTSAVKAAIADKTLDESILEYGNMNTASELLKRPGVGDEVAKLIQAWVDSGKLLPPTPSSGFLSDYMLKDNPLGDAIVDFQKAIQPAIPAPTQSI